MVQWMAWLAIGTAGVYAQEYTVSGFVRDAESGEPLIGAAVYDTVSMRGTTANKYGFYSLKLPAGRRVLRVAYVGYTPQTRTVTLTGDLRWDVQLSGALRLQEVKVVARRKRPVETIEMSSHSIAPQQLKKVPTLLGERDPLRVVQMLPGVHMGSEASAGYHVRGGSPDQNLILLDGVTVYNANHLFGMFSVFNGDAIQHLELLKGGFPARYGGRISSVLDIRMKEGNTQHFRGDASIGLISARILAEGPIKKNTTAFMISGRRTYIDVLARPFILLAQLANPNEKGIAGYFFTDWNLKVHHRLSDRDRLYLSAYYGNDKAYFGYQSRYIDFREDFDGYLRWGNITQSLRWNRVWRNDLFSNLTLVFTRYRFNVGAKIQEISFEPFNDTFEASYDFVSRIQDIGGDYHLEYYLHRHHTVRAGVGYLYHHFRPGVNIIQARLTGSPSFDTTFGNQDISAHEGFAYVEDEFKVGTRLQGNAGVRVAVFNVQGHVYPSVEPRLSLRYTFTEDLVAKASFARMAQFIHLLTNPTISMPTDMWVPATPRVPSQSGNQWAAGLAYALGPFDLTLEGYYKTMQNVIAYRDGASFIGTSADWESLVTSGRGWSYGAEAMIKKDAGRFNGWVSYTLSWSWRQFDEINFGRPFPYKYDRRHNLAVVANYVLRDKSFKSERKTIEVGAAWTYMSGHLATLPEATYPAIPPERIPWGERVIYLLEREYVPYRNNFRFPAYHRLDLALHFTRSWGPWKRTWSIGAYNVYNRFNPFFLYINTLYTGPHSGERVLQQVSLYPILPMINLSISYR